MNKEETRKEFLELWQFNCVGDESANKIADWIVAQFSKSMEERVEKIRQMKKPVKKFLGGSAVKAPSHDITYNQAIDDIINLLIEK